jgi:hypothetical protein
VPDCDADADPVWEPDGVPVTEVEPVAVCDDAAVPLPLAVCDGDAPTDSDADPVPLLVAAVVDEPLDDSDAVRL